MRGRRFALGDGLVGTKARAAHCTPVLGVFIPWMGQDSGKGVLGLETLPRASGLHGHCGLDLPLGCHEPSAAREVDGIQR